MTHRYLAVFGDIMVDEYLYCDSCKFLDGGRRALNVLSSSLKLGGAAAVANILANCSVRVELIGCIGDDYCAQWALNQLWDMGVRTDAIDRKVKTTVKQRIILDGVMGMDRLDFDVHRPYDISRLGDLTFDNVIVSDYGKGVVTPDTFIEILRRCSGEVIVDPAIGTPWQTYSGANIIKCNRMEWAEAKGEPCSGVSIVVTDGANGCYVTSSYNGERDFTKWHHVPTEHAVVVDRTGAGDTVAAALAIHRFLPIIDRCKMAMKMAAEQVSLFGVNPVRVPKCE